MIVGVIALIIKQLVVRIIVSTNWCSANIALRIFLFSCVVGLSRYFKPLTVLTGSGIYLGTYKYRVPPDRQLTKALVVDLSILR